MTRHAQVATKTPAKAVKFTKISTCRACCHQLPCHRGLVVQTASTTTHDCASAGAEHRTSHNQT